MDGVSTDDLEALLDNRHPLKIEVAEWAATHLKSDDLVRRDRESEFDRAAWNQCAAYGVLGANAPQQYGGQGRSLVDALLMLEGLGLGCADNGLVFGITSQIWSTQNVLQAMGTEQQNEQWLPRLINGSLLGAFAISEPETGSDTYALAASAQKQNNGSYVLNGEKAWLTLGSIADVAVVFAKTNEDQGAWGISCFVIDTNLPGVELLPNREKMGMRTTPFGNIRFVDVELPKTARLGEEGAGMGIFNKVMEADRAFVLAGQIGAMERQLNDSIQYARQRKQSGQPIRKFQAVSHRLAEMKVRHEVARTMMYKTALLCQQGRPATMAASISKIVTTEGGVESGMDAVRIFGAKGYVSEFEIDRGLRDFIGGVIYSGTTDIQRNIIASLLGAN